MMAATIDERRLEWNSHLRGAWISVWLFQGSELTTAEIAKLTGMTRQGVDFMMDILSAGMPIRRRDGKWVWVHEQT